MQKTRQKILEYLKQHGAATVEELSLALDSLTPVTVRHHLDVMRSEGLVEAPEIRHRNSPGRPKYTYSLTRSAEALFPKNIHTLTNHILGELKDQLSADQVNVIFDGVVGRMADAFEPGPPDEPVEARLERVVAHLTEHGYMASWEAHPEGYVLHTSNCPYEGVAGDNPELCMLDMRYLSALVGSVPRRLTHMHEGDNSCSYLILRSARMTA